MSRAPHPKAAGTLVGIDEPMIRPLVHTFYARVRVDPLLGPIFNRAIHDWDVHLEKLCAFWSSVTLMTGRYKGTPMKVHANLVQITPEHFDRWLALFRSTATEVCPRRAAPIFIDRANRIAASLQMRMALYGRDPTAGKDKGTARSIPGSALAETGTSNVARCARG